MQKNGKIITDLSMEDYLSHPGIGSSSLKHILSSPADYQANLQLASEETKSLTLGTCVHTLILEPEDFDKRYALQPEDWGKLNENPGKKNWADFKKEHIGKNHVTWKERIWLDKLKESVKSNKLLQSILDGATTEATCFCDYNDITLKARPDCITKDGWIFDLKTSSKDLDDKTISNTIFNYGYHFQAAHHSYVAIQAGVDFQGWGWIFVDTSSPFPHIVIKKASKKLFEAGQSDHKYALDLLAECTKNNKWPSYDAYGGIDEINLPKWAENEY